MEQKKFFKCSPPKLKRVLTVPLIKGLQLNRKYSRKFNGKQQARWPSHLSRYFRAAYQGNTEFRILFIRNDG